MEPIGAVSELRGKSTALVVCDDNVEVGIGSLIDVKRFSSIKKLLRVSAYVHRFIANLRSKQLNGCNTKKFIIRRLCFRAGVWRNVHVRWRAPALFVYIFCLRSILYI